MRSPLAGLRVLELARLIPAALISRRLIDLGADVVKVEVPAGDALRMVPPLGHSGEGLVQTLVERGKRSVAFDPSCEADRETVASLAEVADVILDSGVAAHYQLDLVALRERRPELIIADVSAFGRHGEWERLLTHGLNMDAMAGLLPVVDGADGHPVIAEGFNANPSMELAAANAAYAIVAVAYEVERGGPGAHLEVAVWDSGVHANRLPIAHQAVWGEPMAPLSDLGHRYGAYRTSDDGVVVLGALEPKFWARFCAGIDRLELLGDESMDDPMSFANDENARDELRRVIATATKAEWVKRLIDWKVAGSAVMRPDELLSAKHLSDRQVLIDPGDGSAPRFRDPVLWDGEALWRGDESLPVPPGTHNEDVLREWGAVAAENERAHV